MDTMEIAAFVGKYPEFRPAPLPQIASAYYAAWRWLRNDFKGETHLLSVFAFGREITVTSPGSASGNKPLHF